MENIKITKMSLANIENKLTPAEMENIMAGSRWNCNEAFVNGMAVACYGATFGGMLGGSAGLVFFAGAMLTCR